MQHRFRIALFASLCLLTLLAGIAWHHAQIQAISDRLALLEQRSASAPMAGATAGNSAASTSGSDAREIQALRHELVDLRDLISTHVPTSRSAATEDGAAPSVSPTLPGTGDTGERTRLKAIMSELLAERDAARFTSMTLDANPMMLDHQRSILDDLEGRLRLSAFQKEQIGKLLDERRQTNQRNGDLPPNPEEMMKQMQEADADLERKVREFLTPQQLTEYDQWREETGGWSPLQVMFFTSGNHSVGGGASISIQVGGRATPAPGK